MATLEPIKLPCEFNTGRIEGCEYRAELSVKIGDGEEFSIYCTWHAKITKDLLDKREQEQDISTEPMNGEGESDVN